MSKTGSVAWAQLPFAVEDELFSLAGRCLATDGGLPLAADPAFLRRRWLAAGILTMQVRDHDGRLIAAGAIRPTGATGGVTFCGLVDPGARGRGIGTRLLTWGLTQANPDHDPATTQDHRAADQGQRVVDRGPRVFDQGQRVVDRGPRVFDQGQRVVDRAPRVPDQAQQVPDRGPCVPDQGQQVPDQGQQVPDRGPRVPDQGQQVPDRGPRVPDQGQRVTDQGQQVTVETESLTAAAEELFAAHGLRQVFAEDVMRIDLAEGVPEGAWPDGTELAAWSAADAVRFHRVYEAAFRERPGFPGWTAGQWIADVAEDDDFRPQWSVLATVPGLGDAGFVTAGTGWIVQVGVVPAARGCGLGGALVAEALRRMRADGATHAWLDVNVDNQAVRLYRRLGFEHRGRRARFRLGGR